MAKTPYQPPPRPTVGGGPRIPYEPPGPRTVIPSPTAPPRTVTPRHGSGGARKR